jgi:hypothetical protein
LQGGANANKSSWWENCETSAIGRALANMGMSISKQRPSREEMAKVQRYEDDALDNFDPRRPQDRPRPAPAPPAAPVARTDDDTLLTIIRNDLRDPDIRKKALHDYYGAARDVADLNRRVERVKASGIPEDTLTKAYRHHHTRLAQLFVPASFAG